MRAKTLFDQHEKFEEAQARKAVKTAARTAAAEAKRLRWDAQQEQWRKRREAKERVRDQRQLATIEATDADRWSRSD